MKSQNKPKKRLSHHEWTKEYSKTSYCWPKYNIRTCKYNIRTCWIFWTMYQRYCNLYEGKAEKCTGVIVLYEGRAEK